MQTQVGGVVEAQEIDVYPERRRSSVKILHRLKRTYEGQRLLPLLCYIFIFLMVYSAAWVIPYGFNDDYVLLWSSVQHQFGAQMVPYIIDGRPIAGMLEFVGYHFLSTVADLRYLRGVGIIGIGLLAWLLMRTCVASGMDRRLALVIPIIICCMPAFQMLAGWAILADSAYASIAAGVALLLVQRAIEAPVLQQRVLELCAACALLLLALLVYQPAAMMYWLFAAITLFSVDSHLSFMLKRLGTYLTVMVGAIGVAVAVLRLLPGILYTQHTLHDSQYAYALERGHLVGSADILTKVVWFLFSPFLDALNLVHLTSSLLVAGVACIAMVSGLTLHFRGSIRARVAKLSLALALIPLSYIPNLVIVEKWGTYRTQLALGSVVVFYLVLALLKYMRVSASKPGRRAAILVVYASAVAFAFSASWNLTRYVAVPQYIEYAFLRSQLATKIGNQTTSIYLIPAASTDGTLPEVRRDEFGLPTSGMPQAQQQMVRLALRDVASTRQQLPIVVVPQQGPIAPPADSAVIDMRQLRYLVNPLG